MITKKINQSKQTELYLSIDKFTRTYQKRGISFVITAHSENIANILTKVVGKRGSAEKSATLVYYPFEEVWRVYCDGYEYELDFLGQIGTVIKTNIRKLSTIVNKI